MAHCRLLLIVCVATLSVNLGSASNQALDFTMHPLTVPLSQRVEMNCRVNIIPIRVKEVVEMQIVGPSGKTLVYIRSKDTKPIYGKGWSTANQADGAIPKEPYRAYLSIAILKLKAEDSGTYVCSMDYKDELGILRIAEGSRKLVVKGSSVERRLAYLEDRVATLLKGTPMEAFTTLPKASYYSAQAKTNLIFPDLFMQIGSGYEKSNGVFKAPVSGLYAFHLLIRVQCAKCYVRVVLHHNTNILLKLKVGDVDEGVQGSASAVVEMKAGDLVIPYIDDASPNALLTGYGLSSYSGYLIHT